ncbi:MAG: hypothetical protein K6F00_07505 [Lachnospiraceae bacterium]|nr:hypothetical protein [Lachnospiraceae bacterium]
MREKFEKNKIQRSISQGEIEREKDLFEQRAYSAPEPFFLDDEVERNARLENVNKRILGGMPEALPESLEHAIRKKEEKIGDVEEGIQEKEEKIDEKKATKLKISELRESMDKAEYSLVRGKKLTGWRTKKRHSKIMEKVLDSVRELEKILDNDIVPDNLESDINRLHELYQNISLSAHDYCRIRSGALTDEGKARYKMVLMIGKTAAQDRLAIANGMRSIVEEIKAKKEKGETVPSFKIADAISSARTRRIEEGKGDIKKIEGGGSGTSDLTVAIKNDDSKMFIRRSENLPTDSVKASEFLKKSLTDLSTEIKELEQSIKEGNLTEDELKKKKEQYEQKKSDSELMEKIITFTEHSEKNKNGETEYTLISVAIDSSVSLYRYFEKYRYKKTKDPLINMLYENVNDKYFPGYVDSLKKITEQIEDEYDNFKNKVKSREECRQRLGELYERKRTLIEEFEKTGSMMPRLKRLIGIPGRHINQRDFARKVARIKEGSNVSVRNVATSIMARALGINDMVAESEFVEVETASSKFKGITMEEAKGKPLGYARDIKFLGSSIRYSPDAVKSLVNLQIFDIICGQIDRNRGNYMCKFDESDPDNVEISNIKAIDNDMAFGELYYNTIQNSGKVQQLRSLTRYGKLTIPAVDLDFANRVLAMNPDMIEFLLTGIISRQEIGAAKDRLKNVQIVLREALKDKSRVAKSKKDWEKVISRIEEDPEEYTENTYMDENYFKQDPKKKEKKEKANFIKKIKTSMGEYYQVDEFLRAAAAVKYFSDKNTDNRYQELSEATYQVMMDEMDPVKVKEMFRYRRTLCRKMGKTYLEIVKQPVPDEFLKKPADPNDITLRKNYAKLIIGQRPEFWSVNLISSMADYLKKGLKDTKHLKDYDINFEKLDKDLQDEDVKKRAGEEATIGMEIVSSGTENFEKYFNEDAIKKYYEEQRTYKDRYFNKTLNMWLKK